MASGKEKLNETTLPAHPAQQGLLLATSVGGAAVNCTCAYTIRGPLDSGQLADAYRNALGAFDALRIEWEAWTSGGRWRSVSEPRFEVRQEDVRDQRLTDGGRPGPLLRSRVQHSADRILSASRGPLAVIELLRTEPDVWTVVETIDHSVADGRSLAVLHAAVANIYQRPGGAHFTAPSYQAVLAAAKQPRPESRHYWKQAFAGFDLPAPTAAHSANGTIWQTTVDAENARMLRRAAGKLRGTLAGALLASHGHAIARHTGTGDIATFVAVDGRNAGNFDMFGQLTSLLPARLRHRWHAELGLHITEATRQLLAMREHLDLDVGVLDELGVPVSIARPESTAFIMQSQSDPVIDLPGISVQAVGLRSSDQAGGLVTVASHYPDGTIDITMRAPSGSIYASHISSIGETFHETLQAIVANPAIRLGSDRLLPPPTRTLIEQLAIPEAPFPFSPIDGDILANLVADGRRPVLRDAGRTYTAAELLRSVRSCQARLVDGGVAAGVAVSVGELPTFERIAAFVAILTLGAIYVPFDGAADSADVRHTERRCQAAARITAGGLVNLRAHDAHVPPAVADANDPAYVIFTSGTSGEPKGVVVSRQSLANLVRGEGQRFGIGVGSNVLLIAPPTVDPWICHVTAALLHQATLVRIDATSDGRLADRIAASRITHAFLPAALVRLLTGVNLPDLQMLASAGDHCRAADLTTFLGRRIFNIYGPTETTVTATVAEITDFTDPVPIGSPIRGFGARVLIDGMASAPPGVCGELALSGAGVAIGYLGDDVRTEARFRRDVLDPGDRYYLTGDIAWLRPDGQLVITGRVDRQVKVRGTRVEPEAVESAALSTGHCSDAFLHAFTPSGSPDKQLTLFVAGCQDVAALVAVLRAKVARPAWPHHVVALDEIPRRASGKVADELLPTDYRRGGQAAPAVQLAAQPDPLAAAWIEVLGAAPTADDDFFAMGGDSLNVLRLVRHARGSGLSLSPADVYRYPRFGELRRQCTTQSPGPDQVPTFRPHARTIPVGPAQQWFLNMVFAAPREWQQRHTIQLAVLPSAERLGDALTALTAATPLLRSAFDPESLLFRVGKLQPLRASK
jgi:non-ribosomal peptide synthetase component F